MSARIMSNSSAGSTKILRRVTATLLACWITPGLAQTDTTAVVETIIEEQVELEQFARQSQQSIARLDEQAGKLLAEYRQILAETESLRRYNEQMETLVLSQETEMQSIEKQFSEIETTSREVIPLMQRMQATLGQFVELDVPFLLEERRNRITSLQEIMGRADVTVSEKYRRILEAYGVEMEYGRTIEAYRDVLLLGSEELTVDFLRLGRAALMFQSLDGEQTGYFDAGRGQWVRDNDYERSVRLGLRIARQQSAPDLLVMPVSAPKEF